MIKNVKIMVVEKDSLLMRFMVDVLEFSVNREVLSFDSGADAIRHIENNGRTDIILCGTDMNGISGLDLVSQIKSKWPHIICIAISDQSPKNTPVGETLADLSLNKPFDTKDLFDIVQKFVVEGQAV